MDTANDGLQVGARIREIRQRRRLTLTSVAQQAGVSKSLLSQVERGTSNASLPVIRSIAKALGVPLFTLFVEDEPNDGLVRRENRRRLDLPGSNVKRELLVPDFHRRMVLVMVRFEPGDENSPEPTSHSGEECIVVLAGSVEVEVNSHRLTLNTGDSYYFDSKVPHVIRNVSDEPAETLAAVSTAFLT